MLQNFIELGDAQKVSIITTLITAIVSVITLFFTIKINRNTVYNNSVTKERIESMHALKSNVSKFNGIVYAFLTDNNNIIDSEEIYSLKNLIEYQLNDTRSNEIELLQKINNILWLIKKVKKEDTDSYENLINEINNKGISYANGLIALNTKQVILSTLNIEFGLFEEAIKIHIKSEWEKIKKEAHFFSFLKR